MFPWTNEEEKSPETRRRPTKRLPKNGWSGTDGSWPSLSHARSGKKVKLAVQSSLLKSGRRKKSKNVTKQKKDVFSLFFLSNKIPKRKSRLVGWLLFFGSPSSVGRIEIYTIPTLHMQATWWARTILNCFFAPLARLQQERTDRLQGGWHSGWSIPIFAF